MLEAVEDEYNKMIGCQSKCVHMIPIIPYLVSSTDKITIFASASIIEGKDPFYIDSKPTFTENILHSNGSRNNYKKKQTYNDHC